MAVTTWEEALKDLTPGDVWAMRKIRNRLRAMLLANEVTYTTFPNGIQLDRLEIKLGDIVYVITGDNNDAPKNRAMNQLWLALDEVIWSFDGELAKPDENRTDGRKFTQE